jgi:hypothetical protein
MLAGLDPVGCRLCPECGKEIDWYPAPPPTIRVWRGISLLVLPQAVTVALAWAPWPGRFGLGELMAGVMLVAVIVSVPCSIGGVFWLRRARKTSTDRLVCAALGLVLSALFWAIAGMLMSVAI